jgi:hypothetical protein
MVCQRGRYTFVKGQSDVSRRAARNVGLLTRCCGLPVCLREPATCRCGIVGTGVLRGAVWPPGGLPRLEPAMSRRHTSPADIELNTHCLRHLAGWFAAGCSQCGRTRASGTFFLVGRARLTLWTRARWARLLAPHSRSAQLCT